MARQNHNDKEWYKIARQLTEKGIRIEERNGKRFLYPPNKADPLYSAHIGLKSDHPVRRWAQKLNPPVIIKV